MLHFLFLIFFLAAVYLQEIVALECSDEQSKKLESCYHEHFSFIGIQKTQNVDYNFYSNFSKSIPLENYPKIREEFRNCLGNEIIENCINENGFSKIDFAKGNEKNFTIDFWLMDYTCGDGFPLFKSIHECLINFNYTSCSCNKKPAVNCSDYKQNIECYSNCAKIFCGDSAYTLTHTTLSIKGCYESPQCETCLPKKK